MRVTLDTNVLVSAFISRLGVPAEILDFLATFDELKLVLSDGILDEFEVVMNREEVQARFDYSKRQIKEFRQAIQDVSEIIEIASNLRVVVEDPADDVIVNTAVDGKADYIVSGDKHLLKIGSFKGTLIVSPRSFVTVLADSFGDLILAKTDV